MDDARTSVIWMKNPLGESTWGFGAHMHGDGKADEHPGAEAEYIFDPSVVGRLVISSALRVCSWDREILLDQVRRHYAIWHTPGGGDLAFWCNHAGKAF